MVKQWHKGVPYWQPQHLVEKEQVACMYRNALVRFRFESGGTDQGDSAPQDEVARSRRLVTSSLPQDHDAETATTAIARLALSTMRMMRVGHPFTWFRANRRAAAEREVEQLAKFKGEGIESARMYAAAAL